VTFRIVPRFTFSLSDKKMEGALLFGFRYCLFHAHTVKLLHPKPGNELSFVTSD